MTTKDGFSISYTPESHTVTVSKSVNSDFDAQLSKARALLGFFKATKPGSTWGCDGVGYGIQKKLGVVRVNKSGIGINNFQKGLTAVRERNSQKHDA